MSPSQTSNSLGSQNRGSVDFDGEALGVGGVLLPEAPLGASRDAGLGARWRWLFSADFAAAKHVRWSLSRRCFGRVKGGVIESSRG